MDVAESTAATVRDEAAEAAATSALQQSPMERTPSSISGGIAEEQPSQRQTTQQVRISNDDKSFHAVSRCSAVEVVTVQRNMLHDDVVCDLEDLEIHMRAEVLQEKTGPHTNHKYLQVRFEDEEILEVCTGAVHRPELLLAEVHRDAEIWENTKTKSALQRLVTAVVEANEPYDGHESSAEDFFNHSENSTSQSQSSSSLNINDELAFQDAVAAPQAGTSGNRECWEETSDSTMLEGEYQCSGKPRAAMPPEKHEAFATACGGSEAQEGVLQHTGGR